MKKTSRKARDVLRIEGDIHSAQVASKSTRKEVDSNDMEKLASNMVRQ